MTDIASPSQQLSERLAAAGIQPSAQRLAIGSYVLSTEDHPSADQVLDAMKRQGRSSRGATTISRATVYNTLNLFVEKGLLKQLVIAEGHVVFDPRLDTHHHFFDTDTGEITDLPVDTIELGPLKGVEEVDVEEVHVVVRGTRHGGARTGRQRRSVI